VNKYSGEFTSYTMVHGEEEEIEEGNLRRKFWRILPLT
jgi:hypothetical protein